MSSLKTMFYNTFFYSNSFPTSASSTSLRVSASLRAKNLRDEKNQRHQRNLREFLIPTMQLSINSHSCASANEVCAQQIRQSFVIPPRCVIRLIRVLCVPNPMRRSRTIIIHHSAFSVQRSAFNLQRSTFSVQHSAFILSITN